MDGIKKNRLEDRHLVNLILKGDKNAFALLVGQTERLVAQIIFKMIADAEDRKDLAQEVYLKAYKGLGRFNFQSALSTWVAQIAYNACLDHLGKKKFVVTGDLDGAILADSDGGDEPIGHAVFRWGKEADRGVLDKQRMVIIQQAIEKLPPMYRTLITLYHNEDLSYEQIGTITGLPSGTVKNYLFRARKTLKEYLLRHYKKEEL